MKQIRVYISRPPKRLYDWGLKAHRLGYASAEIKFQGELERLFGGWTAYQTVGGQRLGWQVHAEKGVMYEMLLSAEKFGSTSTSTYSILVEKAKELGAAWGQEKVVVTVQDVAAEIVNIKEEECHS